MISPSQSSNAQHLSYYDSPSSALSYDAFWALQNQLGVAPLRDNLNYAAAQNRNPNHVVGPYHEPMYAYNGGSGTSNGQFYGIAGSDEYAQPSPHRSSGYAIPDFSAAQDQIAHHPLQDPTGPIQYASPPDAAHYSGASSHSPQSFSSPVPQHVASSTAPAPANSEHTNSNNTPATNARRKSNLKRKRPRRARTRTMEDDDEDDSDDDDNRIGIGPDGRPVRLAGACTHCKRLKMKCEFEHPMDTVCKRCRTTRHQCIVEGRKPRTQPNKREFLLAQIRQKDQIIEKLLKQIQTPELPVTDPTSPRIPASTNPDVVAWIEQAQASVRAGQKPYVLDGRAERDTDEEFFSADEDSNNNPNDHSDSGGALSGDLLSVHSPIEATEREKLHSLPAITAPLGLIAKLSLDTRSRRGSRGSHSHSKSGSSLGRNSSHGEDTGPNTGDSGGKEKEENDLGVANIEYFRPANVDLRAALMINQPPEILVHGLVTPQEVDALFQIFYDKLNPFLSILDPKLYTPSSTFSRCPFLFTVICAISSRYYEDKATIYPITMYFAKQAASRSLIEGVKCVEMCQAYILLALYSMPARRWEEDRGWLYLGLAIRIATDLNLHHPTLPKKHNEMHEREILNRTRTWIILFNLDRSTSTQLGKPSTIREDYIIHNSETWYKSSPYNSAYDIHMCYYAQLLRIVARFHEQVYNGPVDVNTNVDVHQVILNFYAELQRFGDSTQQAFDDALRIYSDDGTAFRSKLTPFLVNYSRLVMFSFGFQRSFNLAQNKKDMSREDQFLDKCLTAAWTVMDVFINALAPSGYMRYSPDAHFVFVSFACAFVIKLLRADLIHGDRRQEFIDLISKLIETLGSKEVAIDEKHTPKLYSRFLQTLLDKYILTDANEGAITSPDPMSTTSPSSARDSSSNQGSSTSGAFEFSDSTEHPPNPSISVEYTLPGGDPHIQLLHGTDNYTTMYQPLDSHNFTLGTSYGDDRLSATSSTIGDTAETATQMGHPMGGDDSDMLASMRILNNPNFFDHMLMPPFAPPQWGHAANIADHFGEYEEVHPYQHQQ